jgi:hypothetical protein
MYGVNYNGLRKRDTYDEIVKYIESDPTKIRYLNRQATFLEQSHYMKHLGGEDYIQMEEQQLRASKEKVKEDIIRERAGRGNELVSKGRIKERGKNAIENIIYPNGAKIRINIIYADRNTTTEKRSHIIYTD